MNMIPFFLFYSIFGFQRAGDLIWAAGDSQAKGFLVGGTSGRTTLAGEGLQHQDGQSHAYAYAIPNLKAYDPAFAYEIAVIVRDGIYRMFEKQENIFYYITIMNEFYKQPVMPEGVKDGILKGMYRYKSSTTAKNGKKVHLLGSGAILNEVIKAQEILEQKYQVAADVWSVTSYKELHRDALETERWNMYHANEEPKACFLQECLAQEEGVFVAASDYLKVLPASISQWIPGRFMILGTDGYGRSDTREALRDFFEVDARHIAFAALYELVQDKKIESKVLSKAVKELDVDPNRINPVYR
jgi:pyruvate dehydrogenase E1 component